MFTKKDLQNGDVVEYRNGAKRVVIDDFLFGEDGYLELNAFQDNLKFLSSSTYNSKDIVKVYRNPRCFTACRKANCIYDREKEETKEMTLEEICKELGYNVKVIKEKR